MMDFDLNFPMYFNILFISILGLGLLFGFLRGMKKAMYSFVVTLIFLIVFFLTLNVAVNFLYNVNIPFLGRLVGDFYPALSSVTTLKDAIVIVLSDVLGTEYQQVLANENLMEFVTAVSFFVVKIAYTIIYFTVIQIIYRFIMFLIRVIFFGNKKKDKKRNKHRLLGSAFGLLSGAISVFITIIILGGVINIAGSITAIAENINEDQILDLEFNPRGNLYQANYSVITLSESSAEDFGFEEALSYLNDLISAYNENMVVKAAKLITIPVNEEAEELSLYLFDQVISMDYKEEKIAFRKELQIFSQAVNGILSSEFFSSSNLGDLQGQEIRDFFTTISNSQLLGMILPLGIEVASEIFETDISVPVDELYDIAWKDEILRLGAVAATVFDILSSVDFFAEEPNLVDVTLDGTQINNLFDELSESEIVNLAAYVAIEPVLKMADSLVQSIVTVPEDIIWKNEIKAIGHIAGEIFNTGITLGNVQSNDPMLIITTLSSMDFTIILNSRLVTNALINILSGNTELEIDLSYLIIPEGIIWLDLLDDDGNILVNGELRNILLAINALAGQVEGIDLNNFDLSTIAQLDVDAINTIFESLILVASVTELIKTLDLGAYNLIIPDSVFDDNGYILKLELQSLATAIHMAAGELLCDLDDEACQEIGFDIGKALTLSSNNIDTLLNSEILSATVGKIVIDLGEEVLTIPNTASVTILVNEVGVNVVGKEEIKNVFLAVQVLEITDFDDIEIDTSILKKLADNEDSKILDADKAEQLFDSMILHATISSFVIDLSEQGDQVLVVPYLSVTDEVIRYTEEGESFDYISKQEMERVLTIILSLEIDDFDSVDTLDLNLIIDNSQLILDSAILHATISKQLLDLNVEMVVVPYLNEDEQSIRLSKGTTVYLIREELEAVFDALKVVGIDDINDFDGEIDIDVILSDESNITILLASAIIHATVSKQLIDLDDQGTISLPYLAEDNITVIRKSVGLGVEETVYVVKIEIEAMFEALNALEINDIESFTGDIDLSLLADSQTREKVLASSTIQATISKQLFDLDNDGTLVIPYLTEDNITEIRVTVGSAATETVYIISSELDSIFIALNVLEIDDVNSFDGDIDIDKILSDENNITTLLASAIIHATVSRQLIDLDDDGTISLPYLAENNITFIRKTVGLEDEATVYVVKNEIESIFKALNALEISDIESFSGDIDLSLLADPQTRTKVLASSTIQATISKQLLDLDADGTLVVPHFAEDNTTLVRVNVGSGITESTYVIASELDKIFIALNILEITDINSFDGNVDLSVLAIGNNAEVVLSSDVIQATVSKQVLDLDNDETIKVPYFAEDNLTIIRTTVGSLETETIYVTKIELEFLVLALDLLEINDVNTFDGNVDLSLLSDSNIRSSVLSSAVIQATISKQLFDLDNDGTLVVPYLSEDNVTEVRVTVGSGITESVYVIASELDKIFVALNILEINDINSFDGNVDISVLAIGNNAEIVLSSDVIQATVSKQVLALDEDETVKVPYFAEDNLTIVRTTVSNLETETIYITKVELEFLVIALNILEITDVNTFDGNVDISLLSDQGKREDVLSSTIIQATISKQLFDLHIDGTLVVPYLADDNLTSVRIKVGEDATESVYVKITEIDKIIIALNILGITDVNSFDGKVDISILAIGNNAEVVLSSDVIQATVSKQVLDLDSDNTIKAPFYEDDNLTITRLLVGELTTETEYIIKSELEALVIALNILGIEDINTFDGEIDLTLFYELENRNILLASAIMQATITKQVLELGDSILSVPTHDIGSNQIRISVGVGITLSEYLSKNEIHALFEALELLNITKISDFDGTVSLNRFFASMDIDFDQNQNALLSSASMHATITKQIEDLGSSIIAIPSHSINGDSVDISVMGTYYIYKNEIKALINALDILGINAINSFNGTVDLTPLFESPSNPYYDGNQDILLTSSLMHKTITNQITNLGSSVLLVPSIGFDGITNVDVNVFGNYYIHIFELKALINALNVFGINDITSFDGTINIQVLELEIDQNTVLLSESMHATISQTLFDLSDSVLIIPIYSSFGEFEENRIQKEVNLVSFVYKIEIKSLINAFIEMGYSDLNSFGVEIDSQKFFDNPDLYLTSVSIHATLSDKLLNHTGGKLIIPDANINSLPNVAIRLIFTDVTYIEMNEIRALLDALDELGLTDFSNIDINPTNLLDDNLDLDIVLASASMQATISDTLLAGAGDDSTAYGTSTLIIPNIFREIIMVDSIVSEQIEINELKDLIAGLKELDVQDFSGSVSASSITSMTPAEIDTILISGSLHVTINHMIWGNANINTLIPDFTEGLALTDLLYDMANIIIKTEVKDFIIAAQTASTTSDITNISFDYTTISAMTPEERDVVLNSMIVRNIITNQLSAFWTMDPFYSPANTDFEENNPLYFLTKSGVISVMTHYGFI